MHIMILGSGVIGITSAWYLARAGHRVTVVDRHSGPALETSFANAGMVSPGYSAPWAAPGVPLKAIKWLMSRHAPLVIRPTASSQQYRWMTQMLRQCTASRYAVNKSRMMRLAEYSLDCLQALRNDTGIHYEHREQGTLQLFRSQKQLDAATQDMAVLDDCGVAYELLDRRGCVNVEPGLAYSAAPIAGGLRLPGDETGDCHLFTQSLAAHCEALGVEFLYNTSVDELISGGNRLTGIRSGNTLLTADRYVLALGCWSPQLLKPLDLALPVYPVKGYSLTADIADTDRAPVSTIMDETYKVAVTRFQNRIRIGGMAELAGYDLRLRPAPLATLRMVAGELFPGAAQLQDAKAWTGLRPMTPDGTPVIGATRLANLFLNTGHGTLGWTMSCGSAKLLSDLIDGQKPAIAADDLGISRYTVDSGKRNHSRRPVAAQ